MLDMTAIGALVESFVLAASRHNLRAALSCQSEAQATRRAGRAYRVEFDGYADTDPLADYLDERCTTRRMQSGAWVPQEITQMLQEAARPFDGVQVDFLDSSNLRSIASLVAAGNRMRFENKLLHSELTSNLRFTSAEATATRDGLDVRTLQLPFGVSSIMRSLQSWNRTRIANWFGYSGCVESQARQEVLSSGGIGIISVDNSSERSLLAGGRAFQRIWLEATRQSIALHPVASLPVCIAYTDSEGLNFSLAKCHLQVASHCKQHLTAAVPSLSDRFVQMAFRIGYGQKPSTRTLRRPLTSSR